MSNSTLFPGGWRWNRAVDDLHDAIRKNNMERIPSLVERFPNAQVAAAAVSDCGRNALHVACRVGKLPIVRYLVQSCAANVAQPIRAHGYCKGWTPLHMLCRSKSSDKMEIARYLVDTCGANVLAADACGRTALHDAASVDTLELVRYLVEKIGRVNVAQVVDNNGETALFTVRDNAEIARYLVESCGGAQLVLVAEGRFGWSALHFACFTGRLNTIPSLVEATRHVDGAAGTIAIMTATDNKGRTALHLACLYCTLTIVQYFVEVCGANIRGRDGDGATTLHFAAQNWKDPAVIRYLVLVESCRASAAAASAHEIVHDSDQYGATALHYACERFNFKVIPYLVETCFVNVVVEDCDGETALHIANRKRDFKIVLYLVAQFSYND